MIGFGCVVIVCAGVGFTLMSFGFGWCDLCVFDLCSSGLNRICSLGSCLEGLS